MAEESKSAKRSESMASSSEGGTPSVERQRRQVTNEPGKEMIEKALEAIEKARASGKIRKGANEVTKAVEKGQAKLVVIAKDISPPEITMHLPLLCEEKGIPCIHVPSKEELGVATGIRVPTSAVAIVQEGEAKALIKEISAALKK